MLPLFKYSQLTRNINDDHLEALGIEEWQWRSRILMSFSGSTSTSSPSSIRRVAAEAGLRRMSAHRILRYHHYLLQSTCFTSPKPFELLPLFTWDIPESHAAAVACCRKRCGKFWFSIKAYLFLDGLSISRISKKENRKSPCCHAVDLYPSKLMILSYLYQWLDFWNHWVSFPNLNDSCISVPGHPWISSGWNFFCGRWEQLLVHSRRCSSRNSWNLSFPQRKLPWSCHCWGLIQ